MFNFTIEWYDDGAEDASLSGSRDGFGLQAAALLEEVVMPSFPAKG
jgi:hypothetical protein